METTTNASGGTTRRLMIRCAFCDAWNRVDAGRVAERPKCGSCARPMLLDRPIKLTDDSFARTVAESDVPIVVDFYADWCAPCKVMAPAVDQLATAYAGKVVVAKLDTDRSPKITEQYGIRGMPTVLVFQLGKEVGRRSGALPYRDLEQLMMRACGVGA